MRLQRLFAPIKKATPRWMWSPIRRVATAILTPVLFTLRSGHFRSSLKGRAVDGAGQPLPWYTYPAIDFLAARSFADKTIVEFGAGQSTHWWAKRARRVIAFDESEEWLQAVRAGAPSNVDLHFVRMHSPETCVEDVQRVLSTLQSCDVVVIDGLYRCELIPLALEKVAADGIIVCDDAESYDFHRGFLASGLKRADFIGHSPGVSLTHSTSIYFGNEAFVFDPRVPIPDNR